MVLRGIWRIRKFIIRDKIICVTEMSEVSERVHSRLNAGAKTYLYRRSTNTTKNVFERRSIYDFDELLDVEKMKEATAYLIGEHDFHGFCAKKIKKSTIRKLYSVEFRELPGQPASVLLSFNCQTPV